MLLSSTHSFFSTHNAARSLAVCGLWLTGRLSKWFLGKKQLTPCRQGLPLIELCHKGIMSLVEFGA
jgi:hypothetical protein